VAVSDKISVFFLSEGSESNGHDLFENEQQKCAEQQLEKEIGFIGKLNCTRACPFQEESYRAHNSRCKIKRRAMMSVRLHPVACCELAWYVDSGA